MITPHVKALSDANPNHTESQRGVKRENQRQEKNFERLGRILIFLKKALSRLFDVAATS